MNINLIISDDSRKALSKCIELYVKDRDDNNLHLWTKNEFGDMIRSQDGFNIVTIGADKVNHFLEVVNHEF